MTVIDHASRSQVADRVSTAGVATMDARAVDAGERTALYEALRERGPLTSESLARIVFVDESYARRWLEQQAVTGIVTVDADEDGYRFRLPAEHGEMRRDGSGRA